VSLETGNVLAPSFRRAMSCAGCRFAFTLVISPAMPATMGDEKLVAPDWDSSGLCNCWWSA